MGIVLMLAVFITLTLFYVVVKVREEYLEDVVYHEIKSQEIAQSKSLIIAQREELLSLQRKIHEVKQKDGMCELDPSKECTLCDDKCPFRKEGGK